MDAATSLPPAALREAVLATEELGRRPARAPQHAAESQALLRLMDELATAPGTILQRLADTIVEVCRAGSAGISLLEPGDAEPAYRWRAVSGALAASGTAPGAQPQRLSPWTIALDRSRIQLFRRPERLFPELAALRPAFEEVLIAPFTVDERVIGTLWAVHHRAEAQFDREDARLLERLKRFATVAWRLHESAAALRESEAHARHTVELNPQVPWTADTRGRILDFSERWLELTGMTREAALGEGWTNAPHPEDFPAMQAAWQHSLETGEPYDVEHRIRVADGGYRWMRSTARPRRDAQGRILRWYGSTEDVDERRRVERELRDQQTQTTLALEATGVGVFRYELPAGQLLFSARLKAIWGLADDEEPTLQRIHALVHADDREIVRAVGESLDPQGPGRFSIEHRIVRPDGEVRWIESRGHTEFADGGDGRHARRCVGTMLDVTTRHLAQDALLESRRRFATLIDALPQLTWSSRPDGHTDYLSPQWLAYTGQTHEQSIGFGWTSALHPDDVPGAVRKWDEVLSGPGAFEYELRIRGTDGHYRWFLARATAMIDAGGRLERWYGSCTDIDLAKRVQGELARREAQLELATRIVGAGVFDHDYLRDSLFWSERLREMHELPPDAEPSLAILDAQIHPADRAGHMAAVEAARDPSGPGTFVSEYRLVRHDGEVRWMLARAQTYFDLVGDARRAVRTIGVEQDVTGQRRIEAALRETQQRFVALADSVPALAWTTDADGTVDYLNRRWYEYTGLTPEVAYGKGWVEAVHPDDRGTIECRWRHALQSGEPLEAECRLRRHDGVYRWFSARATPQHDAGGRIDRWFGTSSDVDEIRRLVFASEHAAERLRLATDAARLGILEYFMNGRTHWDARARALWGFGPEETVSHERFMARIHAEDRAMVQESIDRVLDPQRSSGRYEAEYRVTDHAGVERWVRATGRVRFEDGRPLHVIGTVQDVTAQKAIEAELRAADRRKDEFLATLAHELRNPLAPIRNAAKILATPQLDEAALQWSRQVIQRQVTHMAWLLDDLLDVARITQGKLELRRERIALGSVIETAVEAARPLIDGKRHVLAIELPAPEVTIDADPLRLAQVISNLLTNAAKYTDPGGRIALTARLVPPNLVIGVRDSGIGLSAAALRSIFEMFSQVADTLSRSEGGLGIGLALVKGLVELHGGSIEARSEGPGRGSEFLLHLPLPVESGAPAPQGDAAGSPEVRCGRRVLVADDNADAADSLGMILEFAGHEVRVAHGGRAALEIAAQWQPDVALLDIGMPDLNGYETARALRAAPGGADLELIALTGWGHPDDKRRAADAGFDRHLTKPVDPGELEDLLRLPGSGSAHPP